MAAAFIRTTFHPLLLLTQYYCLLPFKDTQPFPSLALLPLSEMLSSTKYLRDGFLTIHGSAQCLINVFFINGSHWLCY